MKKIYKIASIATPVTIMVGSLSVYFAVAMQDTKTPIVQASTDETTVDSVNLYDKYQVFPELRQEDFYDEIRVAKGVGIITEDMIAKILNYIFDHMEVAEGDIGWSYKKIDDQRVIISVKWDSAQKVYSKNYDINLKQINAVAK